MYGSIYYVYITSSIILCFKTASHSHLSYVLILKKKLSRLDCIVYLICSLMPIRMVPIIILVTIRWQTRGANTTSAAVQLDVTTVVRYHTIALNDSTNCSSARLMNILPFSRAFQGERHELEHIGWENPYMDH